MTTARETADPVTVIAALNPRRRGGAEAPAPRLGKLVGVDVKAALRDDPDQISRFLDDVRIEELADVMKELELEEIMQIVRKLSAEESAALFRYLGAPDRARVAEGPGPGPDDEAEGATEEIQKIGGVEPLDVSYFKTGFWSLIRKRGVWLLVLFVEEFFTQTTMRYYDPVLAAIRGSAYYVPLMLSTGGNSGSQSSTLIIRGLAVGEVEPRDWLRILGREARQGLVLGGGLGAIAFARVLMYPDQHADFALTVALTLVGISVMGCTVGAMLPLVMTRLRVDPATSSTPFIASMSDVLGIIVFVHIAKYVMAAVIAANATAPIPP